MCLLVLCVDHKVIGIENNVYVPVPFYQTITY